MRTRPIAWLLCALVFPQARLAADFLRCDANQDQILDVSDAVTQIMYLVGPSPDLLCEDAADSNDDGAIDFSDAIFTLRGLFQEPNPAALTPGPDPTCDPLGCAASPDATPAIVLSEIMYHPTVRSTWEYIEIHNRSIASVDVGGYRITGDVEYIFPPRTIVPAHGFLLVLKEPDSSKWKRIPVPKAGPYQGFLADGGGRITLIGPCSGETVKYNDQAPWPMAADGYGPSVERISYLAPAEDFHTWRSSESTTGTPGVANSTLGVPTHPFITFSSIEPHQPTSSDPVRVTLVLDAPVERLRRMTLRWDPVASASPAELLDMTVTASGDSWTQIEGTVPPQPSQTLVRMDLELELEDGTILPLPYPVDPDAVLSYFVYDFELESKFPILWLFRGLSASRARSSSGAAILDLGGTVVQVFDGAVVRTRALSTGLELRLRKDQSYQGLRTFDIMPEGGNGGSGSAAPFMEHMGFYVWRDIGGLAPSADWFRVIEVTTTARVHEQRLVIQEVNERFLELNSLQPGGDLYKIDYKLGGWAKKTNTYTGTANRAELVRAIATGPMESRHAAILERLDVENVGLFSAISVLIVNWDGFHNNFYAYHDLTTPRARWRVIPWDLDQVFLAGWQTFPIDFPRTGNSPQVGRETGPISKPFHDQPDLHQAYLEKLRELIAPGGRFAEERVVGTMDAFQALLLEDLALLETQVGRQRPDRRAIIQSAYGGMRSYVTQRIPYLRNVLQ